MNIVNKLTLRQLLLNKKRTLVTILGTIISAAMITAVATLGLSFMSVMQRQTIADEGEWHVMYADINKKQLNAIKLDKETKTVILNREIGYAPLTGSQNNHKPYLYIMELNKEGFKKFPIELSEGRLPQKPDELVISEAILSNAKVNYKIGDTLKLPIGKRKFIDDSKSAVMNQSYSLQWENDKAAEYLTEDSTKTYKIVGIIRRPSWEVTWAPGYTVLSYIDENTVSDADTFSAAVIVRHINNQMFSHAQRLAEKNGIKETGFNNALLRYYGVIKDDTVRNMLFILSAIIMVIIMIGSVSLIYNAFAISVSERSRYLGMLSSVGATKRQKRNSVFFEGALIGAVSIPLGILAGYIGLGITFLCINPMIIGIFGVSEGFILKVYPVSLVTSIIVSGITILISTYIPAKRASSISAIDAIRQTADVKITGKQVRTSFITRKIFGIEGELALKNLKRNRKRYKATVFSLIISMVLFLVVSSFTHDLRKSVVMSQDGINFDIRASISRNTGNQKETILKKITSLENTDAITEVNLLNVNSMIKESSMADYLKDIKGLALTDGKYQYTIELDALDDASLQKYAKEAGADYSRLTNTEDPAAIVIDTVKYKDQETDKYVETKNVKLNKGEKLELYYQNPENDEKTELKQIKVEALTGILPMGIMSLGKSPSFHVIISKAVLQKLIEGKDESASGDLVTQVFYSSSDPMKLQENLEVIQNEVGVSKLNIFNVYKNRQGEEQVLLLVSVFTYAFIILITAICIANIINTISTSIALRKREFAMLKSVGITPNGFNKMLNYESIFYGIKSIMYGLPISIGVMYLMHRVLRSVFEFPFTVPMKDVIIVVASVFIIVGTAMLYSSAKVRKENIIDALKQEIV